MKRIALILTVLLLAQTTVFAAGQKDSGEAGDVTLSVMFYSPELQEQYNDMVEAYRSETGVNLDITVLQADYRSVLTSKINSGDIPDIFMSSAYADNSTYKDYVYDLTDEAFMKNIEPAALQGVTVNGRILGYPFLVQSHSFIYNKAVFKDAGITKLPGTIAELDAAAQKLQSMGVQPFATGFKEFWVLPQTAWQVLAPSVTARYGGYEKLVADLNSGKLKFQDIPEMAQVFDVLDLIKKYGGPKPNESDFNDQTSSLAVGKVAIIHQGNWAEDTIKKTNPDVQLGYLTGPWGGSADKAGIMFDSNQTIRIAKDSPRLKASLAWLNWLTTSEYGKNWIPGKIKQMSPIKGAAAPDSQIAKETTGLLGKGVPGYPWFYQMFPTGTEQQLGAILQGYCAGQTDRAETLKAMDAAYAKIAKAMQ